MKNKFLSALLLLLLPVFVYGQSMDEDSQATKCKAAYKSVVSIIDAGQVDKLDAYIAKDAVDHDIDPTTTDKTGLAAVKEMLAHYHKIFPDMKTTIHSMATSGDLLYAYITVTGTTSEPFMGMPSHHKMTMSSVDLVRFDGDKFVEHWGFTSNSDMMKMMPQDEMMDEGME